jgi:sigma-E factor negative regulatory protein RseC
VCGAADQKEKYLDIHLHGESFTEGEPVRVQVAQRLGLKAVALGYVYPLLILMAVLVLLLALGTDELKAAPAALFSVVPYYLVLFLARKRISKTFTFSIQKIHLQ